MVTESPAAFGRAVLVAGLDLDHERGDDGELWVSGEGHDKQGPIVLSEEGLCFDDDRGTYAPRLAIQVVIAPVDQNDVAGYRAGHQASRSGGSVWGVPRESTSSSSFGSPSARSMNASV